MAGKLPTLLAQPEGCGYKLILLRGFMDSLFNLAARGSLCERQGARPFWTNPEARNNLAGMNSTIRNLRWIALLGIMAVLLYDFYMSFPLKPREEHGFLLLAGVYCAAVIMSLLLMRHAVSTLVRNMDLLIPLELFVLAGRLLNSLTMVPGLATLLTPSFTLKIVGISFAISVYFLLSVALAVAYATWMTAAVLELVRSGNSNPCPVISSAMRRFWRVTGLAFICWFVVFVISALSLLAMPLAGSFALILMLLFAIAWNFATAAVLPVAWQTGTGFWRTFRTGMSVSLANLRKWWVLLLAQMLLLGLFTYFHLSWSERNGNQTTTHTDVTWNVNTFWIGGYESTCRWYEKQAEIYKTSTMPFIETSLALILGMMAIAIKIAIVQRMQPEPQPVAAPPLAENPLPATP